MRSVPYSWQSLNLLEVRPMPRPFADS